MLSWNQITLLIAPWLLLATTYLVYQLLNHRYGKKISYLGGFLFYWIIWCMLFPLTILGPQTIVHLFRSIGSPFGQPLWLGAFCLIAPPLVAFVLIFPKALQKASVTIVLVSTLLTLRTNVDFPPFTQGCWRQNRACGAGVVPWTPVGLGRERYRNHSLDSHCAYPD